MTRVVFVAPFLLDATLRFVDVTAGLPGVRVGLISQDPIGRVPAGLRSRLAGFQQVGDGLDPGAIVDAARRLAEPLGGPAERLFGALEQLQVPLAVARAALGLPGVGVETAKNFRDKARMKQVLRDAGLPCARHRLAGSPDDVWTFAREVGFPLVLKPPAGAGARNTFRVDGVHQLEDVLRMVPATPAAPTLVEEFIVGEEHSFDSVMIDGELVWHSVSDYRPTPLDVMENPWIQWCVLLPREIDRPRYAPIRDAGVRALRALGLETGLTHMEWFRRKDDTIAISEVGVRPPGAQFTTLISYAHDVNLYRRWAGLMVFDRFEPLERRYATGAAYLRGMGRGRVKAVHGLDRAQSELGELVVEAKLPKPGQPASGSYEGEGYVILRHPDTDVVARALQRVVQLLRIELVDAGGPR